MTQIFQQMLAPRVSQFSIPDYFFRAHYNESELCVQLPHAGIWGSLPVPQPALQDSASLRLRETDVCLYELRVGSAYRHS